MSKEIRAKVLKRDRGACKYCGGIAQRVVTKPDFNYLDYVRGKRLKTSDLICVCDKCNRMRISDSLKNRSVTNKLAYCVLSENGDLIEFRG